MQILTTTSTSDLIVLLEQALGFDLADSRLLEVAGRIRVLAKAHNDHEALFQATWLLGQHHLSKHEHALALETLESLLDASFTLGAERHANLLLALTDASNGTDQIDKVLKYGNTALGFFRERQDLAKQVCLHGFLGLAFTSLCSFHESLEHHMMALSLCESLGQDFDTATAFINIGWAYCQMMDYPKAQDYFSRALLIAQSHDHALLKIRALGNLANVYDHLGDHQTAIDCYEQVADISRVIGHHKFLLTCTGNIAISFVALGRLDQAMTFFDLALAQLEFVANNSLEGWLHVQMGKALRESKSDLARDHLEYGLQRLRLSRMYLKRI
jgi:tetratricopeptide (TPR) repeat protein